MVFCSGCLLWVNSKLFCRRLHSPWCPWVRIRVAQFRACQKKNNRHCLDSRTLHSSFFWFWGVIGGDPLRGLGFSLRIVTIHQRLIPPLSLWSHNRGYLRHFSTFLAKFFLSLLVWENLWWVLLDQYHNICDSKLGIDGLVSHLWEGRQKLVMQPLILYPRSTPNLLQSHTTPIPIKMIRAREVLIIFAGGPEMVAKKFVFYEK